jgi:protein-S-isoprenylcysteine O-methyltransferase Ste14
MQRVLAALIIVLFFVLNRIQERDFQQRRVETRAKPPIARPAFILGKVAMVLAWLSIVVQALGLNLRVVASSGFLSWLAVAIEGLGLLVVWRGFRDLGDGNQMGLLNSPKLRVSGVYAWSRNPIYVGFHLMTLAAVLYTLNPLVLLLAVTTIAIHHFIVLAEEAHLAHEIGAPYIEYKRRVRRYV